MRLKLIPNPKKSWTKKLVQDVKSFLRRKGHRTVRKDADVTICIGGDGTILYANHMHRLQGSVIGIGTKNSHICQLTRSSWKKNLIKLLKKGRKLRIMAIRARIGKHRFSALNDFVMHAKNYRVMKMDVRVGGKKNSFYGDGIIMSSALGSAAYAYSAGGRKLRTTERKISVVPICPYRRTFSPVVLDGNEKISVKVGGDCAFIIDGIFVRHLKKRETVHVERGNEIEFFEGVGEYKQR